MQNEHPTLDELQEGEQAVVSNIKNETIMKRRLQDLGLIKGTEIECVTVSAFRDICVYLIRGANIAIRNIDAQKIEIEQGVTYLE